VCGDALASHDGDRRRKLCAISETLIRIDGQRARGDRLERDRPGELRRELRHLQFLAHQPLDDGVRGGFAEQAPPGERLPKQNACAKYVCARVDGFAQQTLGGEMAQRIRRRSALRRRVTRRQRDQAAHAFAVYPELRQRDFTMRKGDALGIEGVMQRGQSSEYIEQHAQCTA